MYLLGIWQVFRANYFELNLFQSFKSHLLVSMTTIKFAHQVYVAALTKYAGVQIYRFMGLSGFELLTKSPLHIPNAIDMISFNLEIWNYNLPRPFIAISTGTSLQIINSNINGDAKQYFDLKSNLCKVY